MSTELSAAKPAQVLDVIKNTAPLEIAKLDFVKEKYVNNYNLTHPKKEGELMYHRNVTHFLQTIASSDDLKKADPFSLYACFVTAAVNGYSLDPADSEVYIVPRGGKAYLQRQAGAHVRRLMLTGQVSRLGQAKIVYEGDFFEVENGRVISHKEKFQSEKFVAGWVSFEVADGKDIHFIFRKSDWESWKEKSPMKNGPLWNHKDGQPLASFLKTKLVLHACKSKTWATGMTNPAAEQFNVEVDDDDSNPSGLPAGQPTQQLPAAQPSPAAQAVISAMTSDEPAATATVNITDEEDPFA